MTMYTTVSELAYFNMQRNEERKPADWMPPKCRKYKCTTCRDYDEKAYKTTDCPIFCEQGRD